MKVRLLVILILAGLLAGCGVSRPAWHESVAQVAHKYQASTSNKLVPYFNRAQVAYPPKQVSFLIFKNTKTLQVWAKNNSNQWRYIRSYPILAASGGPGPKLRDGDDQVPEGIYHLVEFNPSSRFDLSLMLDYPNAFDRYHAGLDGRHHLGDDIFIHGSHYSIGCIAIGNKAIHQIFTLAYLTGLKNITVIIAPDDLRYHRPIYGRVHPIWLPQLYAQIQNALRPYS